MAENDLKLKIKADLCWRKCSVMIVRQIWKWEYHTTSFSTVDCYTHSACVSKAACKNLELQTSLHIACTNFRFITENCTFYPKQRSLVCQWLTNQLYPQNRFRSKRRKKWTNNIFCVQSCEKRNLGVERKKGLVFFLKTWLWQCLRDCDTLANDYFWM